MLANMSLRRKGQASDDHQSKSWSKNSCMSFLTCCLKMPVDKYDDDMFQYNADKYEYAVEKLVIKRVPIALFATHQDRENHGIGADIQPSCVSNSSNSSSNNEVRALNDASRHQLDKTIHISHSASNDSRSYRCKQTKLMKKKDIELRETLQKLQSSDNDCKEHQIQLRCQQARMKQEYVVQPMQFNWSRNVVDQLKIKTTELEQLFSLHEKNYSNKLDVQDNVHLVKKLLINNRTDCIHNANNNDVDSTTLKWKITIKHRQPDA